jgi:hypothetical protein
LEVVYALGGTGPLDMNATWAANVAQFDLARTCFNAYVALLTTAISGMKRHEVATQASGSPEAPRPPSQS